MGSPGQAFNISKMLDRCQLLNSKFWKAPFIHAEPIRYAEGKLHEDLTGYWKLKIKYVSEFYFYFSHTDLLIRWSSLQI
jgi:hypothetical protein